MALCDDSTVANNRLQRTALRAAAEPERCIERHGASRDD